MILIFFKLFKFLKIFMQINACFVIRVVIALAIKVRANHDHTERETIKLVVDFPI